MEGENDAQVWTEPEALDPDAHITSSGPAPSTRPLSDARIDALFAPRPTRASA